MKMFTKLYLVPVDALPNKLFRSVYVNAYLGMKKVLANFSVWQKRSDALLLGLLYDCMHLMSAAWFYYSLNLIYGLWKS